ncbi:MULTISPECIES: hypothetical protein [unclassified Agarivorans]|uniref:hypothetical protein n=1 Tax=unclassified Agarivorans TaxID=2636026 RepID=UPI003D7C529F
MKTLMTKRKSLLGFLLFSVLLIPFFEALFGNNVPDKFEQLSQQLAKIYPVIYINVEYSAFISGGIIGLTGAIFMLWQFACLRKGKQARSLKHLSTKAFVVAIIISFLFIFPGRHIERSHKESRAAQQGYQACPPFTLLMSSVSIDAWVKDFSLCNDPEVDKLARYGYPDEPAKIAKMLADRESK